jgi:predicted enzyme related to lactoylglutathione lyase
MIQRMSHSTVLVLDQDSAKAFYVDKLGFELRNDVVMGTFRWLTVSPKGQQDHEIILMGIAPTSFMDEASCAVLRDLVAKGSLGPGVLATADCKATYAELKAAGVEFLGPPTERPYGIEAMMKDDSGNVFSMVQPMR